MEDRLEAGDDVIGCSEHVGCFEYVLEVPFYRRPQVVPRCRIRCADGSSAFCGKRAETAPGRSQPDIGEGVRLSARTRQARRLNSHERFPELRLASANGSQEAHLDAIPRAAGLSDVTMGAHVV